MTAEGVESAEVAGIMCKLGAHCLQGYHFSRSVSEEAMTSLLQSSAAPAPPFKPFTG